jgi:hypothetical protein
MPHAYSEHRLVEQFAISLTVTPSMSPAVARSKVLCEPLAAERINYMFLFAFLFEWKTAE